VAPLTTKTKEVEKVLPNLQKCHGIDPVSCRCNCQRAQAISKEKERREGIVERHEQEEKQKRTASCDDYMAWNGAEGGLVDNANVGGQIVIEDPLFCVLLLKRCSSSPVLLSLVL